MKISILLLTVPFALAAQTTINGGRIFKAVSMHRARPVRCRTAPEPAVLPGVIAAVNLEKHIFR